MEKYFLSEEVYQKQFPKRLGDFGPYYLINDVKHKILYFLTNITRASAKNIHREFDIFSPVFLDYIIKILEEDKKIEFNKGYWQIK